MKYLDCICDQLSLKYEKVLSLFVQVDNLAITNIFLRGSCPKVEKRSRVHAEIPENRV